MDPINPPFSMYTFDVTPGVRNSPALPAVHLTERLHGGSLLERHTLTTDQARQLGEQLITAAAAAEHRMRS